MNKENLANGIVASAAGTTIVLESGHGARMPAAPFFATAAPTGEISSKANSEIVKVTNVSGDTLTVVRAQRGTTTKSIAAGWIFGNGVYVDDIQGIDVTVSTAATTAAKVGTTASGNYSPTTGDVINVTFTLGCNAANPTLNIDGSGAKNIRLGNVNVSTALVGTTTALTLKMWYDGTYWQIYGSLKNDNTTYTEITSAEITAGTASTARAISGRRAQEIVTKAQTGVVKSTTTNNLTASDTAPSSPSVGDVWLDTNDLPEELAPSSIVWKETPAGTINGTNTVFTTGQPYVSGSLQVFINGLAESGLVTETAPGTGQFTLTPAPLAGDNLSVQYQVRTAETGNANALGGMTLTSILQAIYPVGATFISGSDTMPAVIAAIGTWERLKGVVIVGVDEAQSEFDAVDKTGGAKTHTLTKAQLPATPLDVWIHGGGSTNTSAFNWQASTTARSYTGNDGDLARNLGSGQAHNNLQPYKTKYMWERVA